MTEHRRRSPRQKCRLDADGRVQGLRRQVYCNTRQGRLQGSVILTPIGRAAGELRKLPPLVRVPQVNAVISELICVDLMEFAGLHCTAVACNGMCSMCSEFGDEIK